MNFSTFDSRKEQDMRKEASSDKGKDFEEYRTIKSFTQILNGASNDDKKSRDYFSS